MIMAEQERVITFFNEKKKTTTRIIQLHQEELHKWVNVSQKEKRGKWEQRTYFKKNNWELPKPGEGNGYTSSQS